MTKYFSVALLLIVLTLFFRGETKAQYYTTGQDPARVKWEKIENCNYRLIFPDSLRNSVTEWANAFDLLYRHRKLEGAHTKKMPILIHGATAYSNGMVSWAPKRSELYFSPSIDASSNVWIQHLAIHEFRHIQQLSELSEGIYKPFHWLGGEQITGAVLGLFMPQWFLEGDAVDAETRLSKSGRGRNPFFVNEYVPSLLHNKDYSYMKAQFGSYKDLVPNYYHMGYHLVNYANSLHGSAMWDKAGNYVGRNFFIISPFNKYIKNNIGMGQLELYKNTMDSIKNEWSKRFHDANYDVNTDSIVQNSKRFIEYSNLWQINSYEAIAVKTSCDEVSKLMKINMDGELREEKITNIGRLNDENLSANNGIVIWSAVEQQGRWQHADKTTIYIYNTKTEEKTRLPFDDFLFSPNIFPPKKRFIAAKLKRNGESVLALYSTNGEHIEDIGAKDVKQFITPVWDATGDAVYCFAKTLLGKSIIKVNIETRKITEILPPSDFAMSHLRVIGDRVYFSGYYDGRMAIYSIDNRTRLSLCYAPFITAKSPIVTDKYSFVIERDSKGYQIKRGKPFEEVEIKLEEVQNRYAKLIDESEVLDFSQRSLPSDEKDTSKMITKYRKSKLINLHSWMPMPSLSDDDEGINLIVLSQNTLSTMTSSASVGYDFYSKKKKLGLNVSYTGLAPIIDADIKYTNAKDVGYNYTSQSISQRTLKASLGLSLPLSFQNNNKYFTIRPKASYGYNQVHFEPNSLTELPYEENASGRSCENGMYAGIYWSALIKAPHSSVVPYFGTWKNVGVRYGRAELFKNKASESNKSFTIFGETCFIIPSFIKRQAIELYGGLQKKQGDIFKSDDIDIARGYKDHLNDKMLTFQASYKFPIWDSDLSLSRVLYIKRFKGQISCDASRLWYKTARADMLSYGGGISAEVNVFNFFANFDVGCRLYRLSYTKNTTVGFTLSFNY